MTDEKQQKDTRNIRVLRELYDEAEAVRDRVGELVGFRVNAAQVIAWGARQSIRALTARKSQLKSIPLGEGENGPEYP